MVVGWGIKNSFPFLAYFFFADFACGRKGGGGGKKNRWVLVMLFFFLPSRDHEET